MNTLNELRTKHPELVTNAQELDLTKFKQWLRVYAHTHKKTNISASLNISQLVRMDGKRIFELSKEKKIKIETITLLWNILRENVEAERYEHFLIDICKQFDRLKVNDSSSLSPNRVRDKMQQWSHGLTEYVEKERLANKEHIIKLLIEKIEKSNRTKTPYRFPTGISEAQKCEMVHQWWNTSMFHLTMAIKTPNDLNKYLQFSLTEELMKTLKLAYTKGIPFFITPYYASLINIKSKDFDDYTLRSYVIYSLDLVKAYGNIKAWEKEDQVEENKPNAAGWYLPNSRNIHRRYPEVAILIPDSMGRACGGLCASCQRMFGFQNQRLNFNLEKLKPQDSWHDRLKDLMKYFEEDTQLRDILITGGDAFMSQNKTIKSILDSVLKMAQHKIEKNKHRAKGEKYHQMQRVRLGTRLLAYLPMRVNDELIDILRDFRQRAMEWGIKQFIIQTHFQSPLEITPQAIRAIQMIQSAGWIITNQLVYNVGASRIGHNARLRQELNHLGVIPYYTFTVKGFQENYDVYAPISRSLQEREEEKLLGTLNNEQEIELNNLIASNDYFNGEIMIEFLKKHHLPFAATDRSVLNLPGIGKSMTFSMVGINPEGKRILKFNYDTTRLHGPCMKPSDDIYIIENKSIGAYLNQLESCGEFVEDYISIWNYTEGKIEPRFMLFEYPHAKAEDYTRDMNHC